MDYQGENVILKIHFFHFFLCQQNSNRKLVKCIGKDKMVLVL